MIFGGLLGIPAHNGSPGDPCRQNFFFALWGSMMTFFLIHEDPHHGGLSGNPFAASAPTAEFRAKLKKKNTFDRSGDVFLESVERTDSFALFDGTWSSI